MRNRHRAMAFVLASLAALALVACGDDGDDEVTATATTAPSDTATAAPTDVPTEEPTEPGEPPFNDPGETLTGGGPVSGTAIVEDVRIGTHEGYDRIVFEFRGDEIPEWSVAYIGEAVACGSGKPVPVGGGFILQVGMTTAAAHDDDGNLTIDATQLSAGFPQMTEAIQICDFEGHVTWVVGAQAKAPFRAFELSGPARLVVDIEQ